MSRSLEHPDVVAIMAAIDRAIASPNNGDGEMVRSVGAIIVEHARTGERFDVRGRWEPEAVRAVVLAFALHAPDRELKAMTAHARRQIAWCEWWDVEGHDVACGLLPETELPARDWSAA